MNRKGSLYILLFTIITLVLVGVVFFTFLVHNKEVKKELVETGFINKIYYEELRREQQIKLQAESIFLKNYVGYAQGEIKIDEIVEEMKSSFNKDFYEYFEVNYENGFQIDAKENLPISASLKYVDDDVVWKWGDFFTEKDYRFGVSYRPNLDVNFGIGDLGLVNREAMDSTINSCKGQEKIEKCVSDKLRLFDVEFNSERNVLVFKTKRLYFIDRELKNMVFEIALTQGL
jgi:flagellar basal body-associated protein FliL